MPACDPRAEMGHARLPGLNGFAGPVSKTPLTFNADCSRKEAQKEMAEAGASQSEYSLFGQSCLPQVIKIGLLQRLYELRLLASRVVRLIFELISGNGLLELGNYGPRLID